MEEHQAVDGTSAGDESRPITDAAPAMADEPARDASGYLGEPDEGGSVEDGEVALAAEAVAENRLTVERAWERVLEDERLRSDLTDDEAQVLLDWIMAVIGGAGQRGEPLEPVLDQVRGAGREINDLAGARDTLDPAAFATRLRSLAGLPESGPRPFWRRWLDGRDAADGIAQRAREIDGPALIRAIVALLPPRPDPEAPT